ncbi:uncharacterized protein BDV17DRAFT_243823 [Aspergillus undulatus]|uniref:uncharacterized protein n=1 Tax=Aspergillus undulatus TaxID=1810928 RepID=UPI003CCC970D
MKDLASQVADRQITINPFTLEAAANKYIHSGFTSIFSEAISTAEEKLGRAWLDKEIKAPRDPKADGEFSFDDVFNFAYDSEKRYSSAEGRIESSAAGARRSRSRICSKTKSHRRGRAPSRPRPRKPTMAMTAAGVGGEDEKKNAPGAEVHGKEIKQ